MPAFVLVNVELGAEEEIVKEVLEIPEVEEAYPLFGVYDIIIKLKSKDKEKLKKVVFKRIRPIKGVRSTMTMTTAEQ